MNSKFFFFTKNPLAVKNKYIILRTINIFILYEKLPFRYLYGYINNNFRAKPKNCFFKTVYIHGKILLNAFAP